MRKTDVRPLAPADVCSLQMHAPTVLYLTLSAQDYQAAGGRTRIVSEIRHAVGDRYRGRLLCLVPLRSYRHPLRLRAARQALARDAGIPVTYLPKWPGLGLRPVEALARLLNRLWLLLAFLLVRPQVVHSHGAAASFLALGLRWVPGARVFVADLHGVDSAEAMHRAGRSTLDAAGQRLRARELQVVCTSDAQVFVSQALRDFYAEAVGAPARHPLLLPCCTRMPSPLDEKAREARRAAAGFEGREVFAYVGSVRAYQMVDPMLALFREIAEARPSAHLLVLSGHRAAFQDALTRHAIDPARVHLDSVPQAEVAAWLQLADVGFLLREDALVNRVASPTKFAEYLAAGVPVLTTPWVGDYSAVVAATGLGHVLPDLRWGEELASFLDRAAADRASLRARCRAHAEAHLSWERVGSRLPDAYDTLLGTSTRPV